MASDTDATRAGKGLRSKARSGRRKRLLSQKARISLISVGCVLLLWFAATSWLQLIPAGRFPSPAEFWAALRQSLVSGYAGAPLAEHAWHSLRLVAIGFVCATLAGVPLGLLMGYNRTAEALISPVFSLIRPIPPLAWIPLAILWLGLGDAAKVLVIWFAAFVPSVINAHTGVRGIDGGLFAAARMLGVPRLRMVSEVILPGALPMIFTGLRLSLQAAWTTLVAAELVGALMGVGFILNVAQQDIYPSMILVGMVTVGLLGWLTTKGLVMVEQAALARWPQGRS
ncbi:ABC transporter permease [Pseudogemmobacter faecipullorum]|uniref:ABC transporter permease n=1 Tax=Pseudogemmobacter faecipullorum TaxID=2755041 RepID=A0ABS8CM02_9RHOB|nr:ABC transporter permease [Pseudogemmobacter faecipullorum]MCB5410422.1 ABC transporter permease [Pseudogemmobacter faecipullorum]